MDDNELMEKAVNNSKNDSIVKLNSFKIARDKKIILNDLNLNKKEQQVILNKLLNYRLVDEIKDIEVGNYIRWISIKEDVEEIKLTTGGHIITLEIENDGVHIKCKNRLNNIFEIRLDENIIFQKLTDQEELLLKVIDYLET
tara:strand:- start:9906 stop:10331 length:426 start_codon:yes stop_codon:yes gene_type:complete